MSRGISPYRIQALSHTEDVLAGKTIRLRPQRPTIALFQQMARADLLECCFADVSGYQFSWGQLMEFSHAGIDSWEFCMDGILPPLMAEGWTLTDLIRAMRVIMLEATPSCMNLSEGYHPATAMCFEVADGAEKELARAWLARIFLPYLCRITDGGILSNLLRSARRPGSRPEDVGRRLPLRSAESADMQ